MAKASDLAYERFDSTNTGTQTAFPKGSLRGSLISIKILQKMQTKISAAAFCGVVMSTVAVAVAFIALPMTFEYVQRLQANVRAEVDYCKVSEL